MSNYTLNTSSSDIKQTDGSSITSTSTVVDGGTAYGLGSLTTGSPITAKVDQGDRVTGIFGSKVTKKEDVWGVFQSSGTTLTSVADNGSSKCRFTLNSHGLSVGDVIDISGSTSGNLDGIHVITAVPTANTFDTRIAYVASATPGDYKTVTRDFATMTAGRYLIKGYTSYVAGTADTTLNNTGSEGTRNAIHKIETIRTVKTATAIRSGYWDIYSGSWSTTPSTSSDSLGNDHAARPTRATPGELVYRVSGQPDGSYGVVQKDYEAKTS